MKSIEELLEDSRVWRGTSTQSSDSDQIKSISTGVNSLDRQLHWRGWPLNSSTEILCEHWGSGELSLLTPILSQLSKKKLKIAWLNPPFTPYPPALAMQNIEPKQCLVLYPEQPHEWWAAEQVLSSSAFAIVLTWFSKQVTHVGPYRRLQAAADKGQCLHINFRPMSTRNHASPARLRLSLRASENRVLLDVIKQPGGWGGQKLDIKRPDSLLFRQKPRQTWPVYPDIRRPDYVPAEMKTLASTANRIANQIAYGKKSKAEIFTVKHSDKPIQRLLS
ncbi:MAG: protein ImuA [Oceanicoccus sp.]|jgi:protein ImuA